MPAVSVPFRPIATLVAVFTVLAVFTAIGNDSKGLERSCMAAIQSAAACRRG
jgi:hypothetical protein